MPRDPYPLRRHPKQYDVVEFWERGRILSEFQVIYVTRGEGIFQSASSRAQPVRAGEVFMLFPGEWHRYRPNPKIGWDEHWLGFDGDYARQLLRQGLFSPAEPLFHLGMGSDLLAAFARAMEFVRMDLPGIQQSLAAIVLEILGRIYTAHRTRSLAKDRHDLIVNEAKLLIAERLHITIDPLQLARHLGSSYSALRQTFKLHTGFSLHEYQLVLRINEAKQLLAGTRLPVKAVAEKLGFNSAYYFSRLFKKKTGCPPQHWRHQVHGGDHLNKVALRTLLRATGSPPNGSAG